MPREINRETERRLEMLETPLRRLVPRMAIPTIVAMLTTSIYNMADTYFVSFLGTAATAAVGVNISIDQAIMMAGSFLAIGSNSYIARLLGARQNEKASRTLSATVFSAFALGLAVTVFGLIFVRPLVDFLGATSASREYAVDYARYLLTAAPFMASGFVLNLCLRSEGSAVYSMIGMGIGGLLNIALDPLLIFTLGMGVTGAAIATAISKAVSFGILILPYLRRRSILRLSARLVRFKKDIAREIGLMGLPALLRMGLTMVCFILTNRLAGRYSDSALAGISVVTRIMMLPANALLGFAQGFMPVAGYNWGARRFDRVRGAFKFSSAAAVIFIAAVGALLAIFAEQVIRLFTEADAELVEIGRFALTAQCVVLPLNAVFLIVNFLYSALGKPVGATVLSVTRQGICFMPLFFVLPAVWGVWGLAALQALADLLSFLIVIPFAVSALRYVRRRERDELPPPGAMRSGEW